MLSNYDPEGVADAMGMSLVSSGAETPRLNVREQGQQMTGYQTGGPRAATDGGRAGFSSAALIEKAVEEGLPRQALRTLAERIAGGDKNKVAALEWGIVPKTTLERRLSKLSPQESERLERAARLFVHARRALGSEDEARTFVVAPHPELDGRSPIEAARTDLGTRRAEQILTALEYGLVL